MAVGSTFARRSDLIARKAYRLHVRVQPVSTSEVSALVEGEGTIELIRFRFYPGPEGDVQVSLYVEDARGRRRDLPAVYGDQPYITGDDDSVEVIVREPVSLHRRDRLYLVAKNLSDEYEYDIWADYEVDYAGGCSPAALVWGGR